MGLFITAVDKSEIEAFEAAQNIDYGSPLNVELIETAADFKKYKISTYEENDEVLFFFGIEFERAKVRLSK